MAAQRATACVSIFNRLTTCGRAYPAVVPREALAANFGGRFFNSRRLHSESQAANDNEDTHEYEKEKMTAEGGDAVGTIKEKSGEVKEGAERKAETVKEKSGEVKEEVESKVETVKEKSGDIKEEVESKTEEVAGEAKTQASKNADTAKDMFKDFPQKVSETATGLKEVGVEAAKAVKRDASKVAEKAGLKNE